MRILTLNTRLNLTNKLMSKKVRYLAETKELFIDGPIDSWYGNSLYTIMDSVEGDMNVLLNSVGGEVTEGFAIADMLRMHGRSNTVAITGIGLVASIATMVFAAGTRGKRLLTPNATFMIHNPWTYTNGDADSLESTADTLRQMEQQIIDEYVSLIASNEKLIDGSRDKTEAQVKDWMKAEKTFSAKLAVEVGLADGIAEIETLVTAENVSDVEASVLAMKERPKTILNQINKVKAMSKEVEISEEEKKQAVGLLATIKNFFSTTTKKPKIEEESGYSENQEDKMNAEDNNRISALETKLEKILNALEKQPEIEEPKAPEPKKEPEASNPVEDKVKALEEKLAKMIAQANTPKLTLGDKQEKKNASRKELAFDKLMQHKSVKASAKRLAQNIERHL